jgi:acyl carrier protein
MTRQEIQDNILGIFAEQFEIADPKLDDDLREVHEFDSIDAIDLLSEIEKMLHSELSQNEKKQAMTIRTINQICDYVENLARARGLAAA